MTTLDVAVPVLAGSIAVGLGAYAFLSAAPKRLGDIRGDQVRLRVRELQSSLAARLVRPTEGLLRRGLRVLWPPARLAATRRKLLVAGVTDPAAVERFVLARLVGLGAVPATVGLFATMRLAPARVELVLLVLMVVIEVFGPQARLDRRKRQRQRALRRSLPDVLDLLTISVEAGLGFEQAMDRVARTVPGPLADELGRVLGELRAGADRPTAMRALGERTDLAEVRSFVLAVVQADTFGVSIGRILRGQAEAMRIRRRQNAQERAQKAPIKMLVPMVFCIFPALFVVVLGPAVLNIRDAF